MAMESLSNAHNSSSETKLIILGRKLDDTELESLTLLMECDKEESIDAAFKNIRETLHRKHNLS